MPAINVAAVERCPSRMSQLHLARLLTQSRKLRACGAVSVPRKNLGEPLTAALGITFPFNVVVGIPLYIRLAQGLRQQTGELFTGRNVVGILRELLGQLLDERGGLVGVNGTGSRRVGLIRPFS